MKRLIIIRGYPGSGKTTVGKQLERNGHGIFIDHNFILNSMVRFTENDQGIYENISDLEKAMTGKLLRDGRSVIVARGFSSDKEVKLYIELAAANQADKVHVIRLDVRHAELERRLRRPSRKDDFRPVDNASSLGAWVSDHPLRDYAGETIVDANGDIESVIRQIEEAISRA